MQNHQQDIDLFDVFKWLRSQLKSLIISIYCFFRFLVKKSLVLLGLILLGALIGFGLSKLLKKTYKAEIIVYPNLETTPYLYGKVDQLNEGLSEENIVLGSISKTDFPFEKVKDILIEPVEDITVLLENLNDYNNELIPEITENYSSESTFYNKTLYAPAYNLHKITLTTFDKEVVPQEFMNYLEDNFYLQEKLIAARKSLEFEIESNSFSIIQIDSILANLNSALKKENQSVALLSSDKDSDLSAILNTKTKLLDRNADLEQERINLESVFTIFSSAKSIETQSLKSYLIFIFPAFLVFIFLGYHAVLKFKKRFASAL